MQAIQSADLADVAPPSIEDVFSLRRPRDIKAGLSSGIKSAGKGIVGGAVGLLAAPVVGATTGGLPGFAKGVAAGVAGAVLLPVTGVTIGVVQVARGVANQPAALLESMRGKAWDQEQRLWVERPQCALTTYDAAAQRQRLGLPLLHAAQPDYYSLLEVPQTASPEHIKRQYYQLARRHHPDKNAGDAEAHERFQQLAHAYQVLSTPALRKRYDAAGASAVADADWLEPGAFFTMLFGSEQFDHLVGELAIATVAQVGEDGGDDGPSAAELRAVQQARVERLAVLLAALLRRYVEGDADGFTFAMRLEAERLAAASFGVPLLRCIARVYSRQADIYLGGLLGGTLARVKSGRDSIRSHLNIANAALHVINHQEKVAAFDRQCKQRRQQLLHEQQQRGEQLQHRLMQQELHRQHRHPQEFEKLRQKRHHQQQQHVIEELEMTSGELQAAVDSRAAGAGAAGTGSDSDACSSEALDAWDAVWFGNSSSAAEAAAAAAAPAAAGTPAPAVTKQQQQQQWRSSGTHRQPGCLAGSHPRDQASCKQQQPAEKQQQQQQQGQGQSVWLPAEATKQQTSSSTSQCTRSSSASRGSPCISSSSSGGSSTDHLVSEQEAAGSSRVGTASGWQALQNQQAPSPATAAAAADNPASSGSGNARASRDAVHLAGACADAGSDAEPAAADAAGADAAAADAASSDASRASVDELLHRAELEDAGLDAMLAAMWAANVLDIQATLGRVCRALLHDRRASRAVRRRRGAALRELSQIFCAAQGPASSSSGNGAQGAKQQMQAAYEAVMARRMAEQDAADLQ